MSGGGILFDFEAWRSSLNPYQRAIVETFGSTHPQLDLVLNWIIKAEYPPYFFARESGYEIYPGSITTASVMEKVFSQLVTQAKEQGLDPCDVNIKREDCHVRFSGDQQSLENLREWLVDHREAVRAEITQSLSLAAQRSPVTILQRLTGKNVEEVFALPCLDSADIVIEAGNIHHAETIQSELNKVFARALKEGLALSPSDAAKRSGTDVILPERFLEADVGEWFARNERQLAITFSRAINEHEAGKWTGR